MEDLRKYIKGIPDFPKEGILYRDIQPLLADKVAFNYAIRKMAEKLTTVPDYFVGIEARGFIFAVCHGDVYRRWFQNDS